jgi:hypothetical protein
VTDNGLDYQALPGRRGGRDVSGLATVLEGAIREIVRQEVKAAMPDACQAGAAELPRGRWLTPPAAAREIGIPERAVRAMIKAGIITPRLRNVNPNPRQPKFLVDIASVAAEAERVSRVTHKDSMPESLAGRAARVRAKANGR